MSSASSLGIVEKYSRMSFWQKQLDRFSSVRFAYLAVACCVSFVAHSETQEARFEYAYEPIKYAALGLGSMHWHVAPAMVITSSPNGSRRRKAHLRHDAVALQT